MVDEYVLKGEGKSGLLKIDIGVCETADPEMRFVASMS